MNISKHIICIAIISSILILISGCKPENNQTVGIIVPLEHTAMNQIVNGFKEVLHRQHPDVKVIVKNAQGDQTLQRAIIKQFIQQKTDILVPIGTAASQMTVSLNNSIPIISLAAYIENLPENRENLTIIQDEIPMQTHMNFIKQAIPNLNKITIIYSAQDKCFNEVEQISQLATSLNINLQKLMIRESNEIFTISKVIANDSQAIFILKDHPIANSASILNQQAQKLKIPLITSDEGSVKAGGCFALGVKESDIGREGAILANKLFNNQSIPHTKIIDKINLFTNHNNCNNTNIDLAKVKLQADIENYNITELE